MTEQKRPDPDKLLGLIGCDNAKAKRGRLRIFFGSSAGVGKTYAMLKAAREHLEQGQNVLAGILETHGRPETEALLEGILILPPIEIRYRGMHLKELDIDTALTRKPDILLIDELAHSNAPGSRHPKRWQDVMEILEAGIDVFTTLNVQHIESLSDLVAGTTGVWVKETVPDTIFDMAEDIVLVDIDEDDLIQRLREGKVYLAPGAKARAAENFFKKTNLSALREMALRRTADRVDAERMDAEKAALSAAGLLSPHLSEKILVCIGPDALSGKLIRAAKRLSIAIKAPWMAVYVETGQAAQTKSASIEVLERMVERLGGKMFTLHGTNISDEILNFARDNNITKIVVGKTPTLTLRNYIQGLLVDRIIRGSGACDVYVVTGGNDARPSAGGVSSFLSGLKPLDYLVALAMVGALTLPGYFLPSLIAPVDQALLFLIGIALAAEKLGLGPSLFYTLLAASSFHIFILDRFQSHQTEKTPYLLTFAMMLVTGCFIALQSARLRDQAVHARHNEKNMRDLFVLTKQLTATRGRFPVSEIMAKHIASALDVDVTVWMTNEDGLPSVVLGNLPEETYYKDFGALQWCYDNLRPSGRGTSTLPSAAGVYFPLISGSGTIGVIGIYPKNQDRAFNVDEIAAMETWASLLASALDRVRAGEIARQIMVEKEGERLRESFAQAISRQFEVDAESLPLAPSGSQPSAPTEPDLVLNISETLTKEMGKLTRHMLDLSPSRPIDMGAVQMNRRPTSLSDRLARALGRMSATLAPFKVENSVGNHLPDILVDLSLIEQAFANVLEFMADTSPAGTRLGLSASRKGSEILLTLTQERCTLENGVPQGVLSGYGDSAIADGASVPLTVTAGIVSLHGGRMTHETQKDGSVIFSLYLPIA